MAGACEYGSESLGSIKCGDALNSRGPVSFSGRTLPCGVFPDYDAVFSLLRRACCRVNLLFT